MERSVHKTGVSAAYKLRQIKNILSLQIFELNQYLTQPLISQASNKLIFQIMPAALPLCQQHTQEVRGSDITGECIVLKLTEAT